MIICTQDDIIFNKYKDAVNNRKVKFKIQVIFSKWWPIFLNKYKHLNIRPIVKESVDKMINCKTGNLGFHIFK